VEYSVKILICGLPGAGKTTLARELAPLIGGVVLDGDEVRAIMGTVPTPNHLARVGHACTMARLAAPIVTAGGNVICSFICPTEECRRAFGADFTIWIDRNGNGKYPDTQAMWQDPSQCDVRVTNQGSPYFWANLIANMIAPPFQPTRPTALFVGRYQPFHEGHKKLIAAGIDKYGQACVAVRNTSPAFPFEAVKARIEAGLAEYRGKFTVIPMPNIAAVCYGRSVGYKIEEIRLDEDTQNISATKLRAQLALREAEKGVHDWPPV
jgi:hypothetical protein